MAGMAHDAVLGELEQGPFWAALRLKIEARGEGEVTVRMPFGEHILNAGGPGVPIHGGAIAALADFAACAAVWTMPETRSSATISMTVNYIAPAVKTDLFARARVRRHVWTPVACRMPASKVGHLIWARWWFSIWMPRS